MSNVKAFYDYAKGKWTMKVQQFMIPIYGYLVSTGKEGQKVIPVAYIEAVAEWIAKQVEEEQ